MPTQKKLNEQLIWALSKDFPRIDEEVVKKLIENGASANSVNPNGVSALYYALRVNHMKVLEILLNAGADVNRMHHDGDTSLHYALQLGRSHPTEDWKAVTELLLKKGANLNTRVKHIYDHESITLLHAAARVDVNAERVTFLLDQGADINELDKKGRTALHHATQNGQVEVIKVLLDRGAKIDALDKDNSTPLHHAATERRTEAVKLLLQRGAKPSIENRYGDTPLSDAIAGNMARPLIGKQDLIDALVKADPECVHLKNKYGKTPFELARSCANKYIFEYVQDAAYKFGVKNEKPLDATEKVAASSINVKDGEGRTLLHIAVQEGNAGTVKILLAHGADPSLKDNFHRTPEDLAESPEIKQIFKDAKGTQSGQSSTQMVGIKTAQAGAYKSM